MFFGFFGYHSLIIWQAQSSWLNLILILLDFQDDWAWFNLLLILLYFQDDWAWLNLLLILLYFQDDWAWFNLLLILLYFQNDWAWLILLLIYTLIWLVCLGGCLSVCLYPIIVKTAEPIGAKFFVGHLGAPGKVYESSKFQIFVSIKIRSSLNFLKFWKSAKFFVKTRELFLFCFTMYTKRTCLQLN